MPHECGENLVGSPPGVSNGEHSADSPKSYCGRQQHEQQVVVPPAYLHLPSLLATHGPIKAAASAEPLRIAPLDLPEVLPYEVHMGLVLRILIRQLRLCESNVWEVSSHLGGAFTLARATCGW